MIASTVAGFPRIGRNRELKYLVEGYFKKKTDPETLMSEARTIRMRHWQMQKKAGLAWGVGDFSFYDHLLDTALMMGVIPERFQALDLDVTATGFAMARGDETADLVALPMKKWFTTNYHFIQPEIENPAGFQYQWKKASLEFIEARDGGIPIRPVVVGPFTFLKLSRFAGAFSLSDCVGAAACAWGDLLEDLADSGADWIQLDEPVLAMDMDGADRYLFRKLYTEILNRKKGARVLIQTCFGEVSQVFSDLVSVGADGIGLDFVEGPENARLIREPGFPRDMALFAGVVSGRNIWRTDYRKVLKTCEALSPYIAPERLVLSTSCSLLHVPYTTAAEDRMDPVLKEQLAFAEEKMTELGALCEILNAKEALQAPALMENQARIARKNELSGVRVSHVRERVLQLRKEDFSRKNGYPVRVIAQRQRLRLPLLPTTTIGSFPQTGEIRGVRKRFRDGKITEAAYRKAIREEILKVVALQEEIGLDVLVHGEFERNDMVEYFGEELAGFAFTENGWVQSYGTRGVKPPILFGDVYRKHPITVDWLVIAAAATKRPVKAILTGPVTILNWSFVREDIPLSDAAFQVAIALRDEALDLEKAGLPIIQVDEAALREKLPLQAAKQESEYLSWAVKAFRLVVGGLRDETQVHTHMCYSEFKDIGEAICAMDADVISMEAARDGHRLAELLEEWAYPREIGPGVFDIHSPRVPSCKEMEAGLLAAVKVIPKERVWVNPDCGLKTRGWDETKAALLVMVAAACAVRRTLA